MAVTEGIAAAARTIRLPKKSATGTGIAMGAAPASTVRTYTTGIAAAKIAMCLFTKNATGTGIALGDALAGSVRRYSIGIPAKTSAMKAATAVSIVECSSVFSETYNETRWLATIGVRHDKKAHQRIPKVRFTL
jgi:hypothetical protein